MMCLALLEVMALATTGGVSIYYYGSTWTCCAPVDRAVRMISCTISCTWAAVYWTFSATVFFS